MDFIPYGRQSISEEDIKSVVEVLRSDYLTTGPAVDAFESKLADYVGAKHIIAVSSGTAALHLSMLAAGIGPGDRVLTSPNTFLASANAAAFTGATPDFADIEPVGYNLCPDSLEAGWTDDVKAVVAVDFAGQPCDMPRIADIARARGATVIEDGCHGIGGGFHHEGTDYKIGGHPWADLTTFSFHPVKTITTGEGGVIATNDDALAAQCRLLRNHGMTRETAAFTGLGAGPAPATETDALGYYEMHELGYNYRITDLQCALGSSQLDRLDEFAARRREIVSLYNECFLAHTHLRIPSLAPFIQKPELISWHLYVLQIDFSAIGKTRPEFMGALRARGVGSQVHYIPVYLQPWYRRTYGYDPGKCPCAESYYAGCLSLPLYPDITPEEIDRVIDAVLFLT